MSQSSSPVTVAVGRIGLVDAALVCWLIQQKSLVRKLAVHVTESVFEPLLPKSDIQAFLSILDPIDEVLDEVDSPKIIAHQLSTPIADLRIVQWPDAELLRYSVSHVCKQVTLTNDVSYFPKLTTLEVLQECYGKAPGERHKTVGIVSGSFDLIHPGHIQLLRAARAYVDVLVILTLSTSAIRQQEKNLVGDRPIYSESERMIVLSALRPVDHIVVLEELNCLSSLKVFCPNYFIKSTEDRPRPIVQAEAALVEKLGGKTIYPLSHHPGYSSTAIIDYIRRVHCHFE